MTFWQHQKPVTPLPYRYYCITMVVIGLVGFFDSIYLSISHYRVYNDIGYESFCAVSRAINCDTVSQSPYSIFWGLPVPVWGIFGYLFYLLLIPFAFAKETEKKRVWAILQTVAFVFFLYSIILAVISTYYIHSYCIMCILSYGVNLLLLYYSWLTRKRFSNESFLFALAKDVKYLYKEKIKILLFIYLPFIFLFFLTRLFFPDYWEFKTPVAQTELATGVTEDFHPWIGAEEPTLIIEEFTDYQCFQCKKMHFYLIKLLLEYGDKIRLIHYQYPMDSKYNPIVVPQPFHEGSGKLALIAYHALLQKKFWPVNEYLFKMDKRKNVISTKQIAEATGLDHKILALFVSQLNNTSEKYIRQINNMLQRDIYKGMKLGITGTPTYVINGELYKGTIPPDVLKSIFE